VGRALSRMKTRVIGYDAASVYDDLTGAYLTLAEQAADLLGVDLSLDRSEIEVDSTQLGEGYGIPTESATKAISLLARSEGIVTDPFYSGKGFAGLLARADAGDFDGPVVFWHTGGYHSLFNPRYGTPQAAFVP
jgi:1-aminocyclopropane-1-carboxylate deaminase/D-cysteine desulfhydrase-like pyridoxal-dependent ACC family enzyme